jgi:hypothetical protein
MFKKFRILKIFTTNQINNLVTTLYTSGSQIVLCGSQGFPTEFPRETWIHLCIAYFKFYLFLKCFVENNRETSLIGDLFVSHDR